VFGIYQLLKYEMCELDVINSCSFVIHMMLFFNLLFLLLMVCIFAMLLKADKSKGLKT